MSLLLSLTDSNQIEIASGAVQTVATIHARSCTCSAVDGDVAAVQIDVLFTPVWAIKMTLNSDNCPLIISVISDILTPYTLARLEVDGQIHSNNAPNRLAVIWRDPDSAYFLRFGEIILPR